MPIPAALPLAIDAAGQAGQIATAIAGIGSANRQNFKQRQHQRDMYALQRRDALADWHMQNAYNDPAAQMMRLKNAGLNPNLVYGNGVVGNSSTGIRSSQPTGYNAIAPDYGRLGDAIGGIGGMLSRYLDFKTKAQNVDNLEKQGKVLDAQFLKMTAETMNLGYQGEHSKFDLGMKNLLKQNSLDTAEALLDKTRVDTFVALRRDEREAAMNASNLGEAVERILTMRVGREKARVEIDNLRKDGVLKDVEIELSKNGLTRSSPEYLKWVSMLVGERKFGGPESQWNGTPFENSKFDNILRWMLKGKVGMNWESGGLPSTRSWIRK